MAAAIETEDITMLTEEDARNSFRSADTQTLAKGASLSLFGKVLGRFSHVAGQVVIARMLGPDIFGLYVVGWTVLRVVGLIAPLGLDNGVIQYATKYADDDPGAAKAVILDSWIVSAVFGSILGLALFVLAPWLANEVFHKPQTVLVLQLFAPGILFIAFLRVVSATTRLSHSTKYSVATEDLLQPVSNLVFVSLVIAVGGGLIGSVIVVVLSFAVAGLAAAFTAWRIFRPMMTRPARRAVSLRDLLVFSIPASLAAVFATFIVFVDRLLVGIYRDATEVGIYQAAAQTSIVISMIIGSFAGILGPMVSAHHHRNEPERLNHTYRLSTRWGLYVSLPLFALTAMFPVDFMTFVFGHEYAVGAPALVILSVGQLLNVMAGPVSMFMVMTGMQREWLVMSGVTFVLNVAINIVLVRSLGLVGVAIGTSVTLGGLFLWGLTVLRRRRGLWPYDVQYLPGLLALGVTTLVLLAVKVAIPESSLHLRFLLACLASVLFFFGTLRLRGFNQDDRELAQILRSRLKRIASRRSRDDLAGGLHS